MKKFTVLSLATLVLFSCGNDSDTDAGDDLLSDFEFADSLQSQVVVSEEIIEEMIHSTQEAEMIHS